MKGLWLITTLLFAGIITMQACGEKAITQKEKDEIIAAYLKVVGGQPCNPCKNTYRDTAAFLLNTNMLKEMADIYGKSINSNRITNPEIQRRADPKVTNSDSEPDSRAIWFSLDRLKGFIAEIEKGYCGRKCEKTNLGVRIYYARYPNPSKYTDLNGIIPDSFENRHTVFMVPTYDSGSNLTLRHVDFDPRFFVDKTCNPKTLWKAMDAIPQQLALPGASSFALTPTIDKTSLNHGGLIPPPYDDIYRKTGAYFIY